MTVTREQIAAEARTWIGTPWHHQAFRMGVGCDCIGLIRGIGDATKAFEYDEDSYRVRQYAGHSRQPNPKVMRAALREFFLPIRIAEAGVGDIFWFRILRTPMHLGILTEPGIIVHSDYMTGRVIEHGLNDTWRHRIVAAFRFPNLIEHGAT